MIIVVLNLNKVLAVSNCAINYEIYKIDYLILFKNVKRLAVFSFDHRIKYSCKFIYWEIFTNTKLTQELRFL